MALSGSWRMEILGLQKNRRALLERCKRNQRLISSLGSGRDPKRNKYLTMPSRPHLLYLAENRFRHRKFNKNSMDHLLSIDVGLQPNNTIAVPIRYEREGAVCHLKTAFLAELVNILFYAPILINFLRLPKHN